MGLLNRIFGDGETPGPVATVENPPAEPSPPETTPPGGGSQPDDGGLDALVAQVAAEHGAGNPGGAEPVPGKRRGRPPIHGRYSKASGSDGKHAVASPGETPMDPGQVADDPAVSFELPADLVRDFVGEGLAVIDDHLAGRLKAIAARNKVPADESAPVIESARLGPVRRDLIATALPHALREHGMNGGISPTACITSLVLVWGLTHIRAVGALGKKPEETTAPAKPE